MDDEVGIALQAFQEAIDACPPSSPRASLSSSDYTTYVGKAAEHCHNVFSGLGTFAGTYTAHGVDHSARVLAHALDLGALAGAVSRALTARELYVLGLSAFLHDLGMACALPADIRSQCKTDHERWNARRQRHADAIIDVLLPTPPSALSDIASRDAWLYQRFLPQVCRAHSLANFRRCARSMSSLRSLDPNVRYGLVAAILLLADEMDADQRRAPRAFDLYDEFHDITKAHWWKHWLIAKCELEGNVIRMSCYVDKERPEYRHFHNWAVSKVETQLAAVSNAVDLSGTGFLSRLVVHKDEVPCIPTDSLPHLDDAIVNHCIRMLSPITGQIAGPTRVVSRVQSVDVQENPSDVYTKLICPWGAVFRGQGDLATPHATARTYVWVEANRTTMDAILRILTDRVSSIVTPLTTPKAGQPHHDAPGAQRRQSREVLHVTGAVGVGKTHFLGVLIEQYITQHPDLWKHTLLVRCECIDCETLGQVKVKIANALIEEMRRVGVYERLEAVTTAGGRLPELPTLYAQVVSVKEAEELLARVDKLVSDPGAYPLLGDLAPLTIVLTLDNSDRMSDQVLSETASWCYAFSGRGTALTLVFCRPETYDWDRARQEHGGDRSARLPFVIKPPDHAQVLAFRVAYLFESCHGDFPESVFISDLSILNTQEVQIGRAREAVSRLCQNLVTSRGDFLSSLAEENTRLLLIGFLRIFGSWVMTSDVCFRSLVDRRSQPNDVPTGWPRMLEALILGHRRWYSPDFSFVENLFRPPLVEHHGDYFIGLHLLQLLERYPNGVPIRDLYREAESVHYERFRIDAVLLHFATRVIPDGPDPVHRACPLVATKLDGRPATSWMAPLEPSLVVCATQWGLCHLRLLVRQFRYWKHVFYDLVLPEDTAARVCGNGDELVRQHCWENIQVAHRFLKDAENRWFTDRANAAAYGIRPVMPNIIEEVTSQYRRYNP
ncbi:MAG TPA: hypothetical protein VM238_05225 [Phycisphaerae bacterium]|nr:hypothetical protein [Phycisphaerae bacterium]